MDSMSCLSNSNDEWVIKIDDKQHKKYYGGEKLDEEEKKNLEKNPEFTFLYSG